MNMSNFVKERDEAILSLDKDKIISYMKKYDIPINSNDLVFWASMHKAIMVMRSASKEQKENSSKWLKANGFKTTLENI
jgi:hypothetical protein